MAYVLVQHLDARHESILAELLAKGSRMPVSEVKGDTAVEPNHVYVTPGQQGRRDRRRHAEAGPAHQHARAEHMPIDSFLRTLAEAQGPQGGRRDPVRDRLGRDARSEGDQGGRRHRLRPGPESAAYDGMPRSAIASGCVDFVLPPDEIAQELSRLSRHPYVITPKRTSARTSRRPSRRRGRMACSAILALLRQATGADFSAYKPPTIKRRIARRMALVHVEKLEEYARYLEAHADEVQALLSGLPDHGHLLLPRPGGLPGPVRARCSLAC